MVVFSPKFCALLNQIFFTTSFSDSSKFRAGPRQLPPPHCSAVSTPLAMHAADNAAHVVRRCTPALMAGYGVWSTVSHPLPKHRLWRPATSPTTSRRPAAAALSPAQPVDLRRRSDLPPPSPSPAQHQPAPRPDTVDGRTNIIIIISIIIISSNSSSRHTRRRARWSTLTTSRTLLWWRVSSQQPAAPAPVLTTSCSKEVPNDWLMDWLAAADFVHHTYYTRCSNFEKQ